MGPKKRAWGKSLFGSVCAVGLLSVMSGCTPYDTITNEPTSPLAGKVTPVGGGPHTTPLGTAQTLKAFSVTLTGPPAPRVGPNAFEAKVMRNGKPAAQVMVDLNLSQSDPQQIGPEGSMDGTGPGVYRRTVALNAPGPWLARVTVVGTNDTESFFYAFSAAK